MNAQDFRKRLDQIKIEVVECLTHEAMDHGHGTGQMVIDLFKEKTKYYDADSDPIDSWRVIGVSLMGAHVAGILVPKDYIMDFNDLTTDQLIDTLEAVETLRRSHG